MLETEGSNIIHTGDLISKLGHYAGDPCKAVVCVIYNKSNNLIASVGVNQVAAFFKFNFPPLYEIMNTPMHPAKKMLMVHAEEVAKRGLPHGINRRDFAAYCTLQPCMNCVRELVPYVSTIEWAEDNRHQDEQDVLRPYIPHMFDIYRRNTEGFELNYYNTLGHELAPSR